MQIPRRRYREGALRISEKLRRVGRPAFHFVLEAERPPLDVYLLAAWTAESLNDSPGTVTAQNPLAPGAALRAGAATDVSADAASTATTPDTHHNFA
jgi:hypothetical protein